MFCQYFLSQATTTDSQASRISSAVIVCYLLFFFAPSLAGDKLFVPKIIPMINPKNDGLSG